MAPFQECWFQVLSKEVLGGMESCIHDNTPVYFYTGVLS